jgi:hypothetical protein
MNFNKNLNRYKVIIGRKLNKHYSSMKILIIYHQLIYWKLKLIHTKIKITCIEHMH